MVCTQVCIISCDTRGKDSDIIVLCSTVIVVKVDVVGQVLELYLYPNHCILWNPHSQIKYIWILNLYKDIMNIPGRSLTSCWTLDRNSSCSFFASCLSSSLCFCRVANSAIRLLSSSILIRSSAFHSSLSCWSSLIYSCSSFCFSAWRSRSLQQ